MPRLLLLSLCLLVGCAGPRAKGPVEARSLLGGDLHRLEPSGEGRARLEEELAQDRARFEATGSEDDAIWVGRRLAYLGRVQEAVDWYSARLAERPDSARLRRHRGHRLITLRRFRDAELDLRRAWDLCRDTPDEVEPDGVPNAAGVPVSTTHTNVLYHLALALYLQGDFEGSLEFWRTGYERSPNADMRVAFANWWVLALRRAGRDDEARELMARVDTDAKLLENAAYSDLLLLYRGERTPLDLLPEPGAGVDDATLAYGVGAWSWCEGDQDSARALWQGVVDHTLWNAFGHVAAEAELARANAE